MRAPYHHDRDQDQCHEEQDVRGPLGPAPQRRPGSIRRTTSIDMTWPEGLTGAMHVHGRARDIVTPAAGGAPVALAAAAVDVVVSRQRRIEAVSVTPARDGIERMVGAPAAGWRLRAAIDDALPGERAAGTGLHLLLDDLTGCTVIAPFAWSRWPEHWQAMIATSPRPGRESRENVCVGYRTGSSALTEWGDPRSNDRSRPVGPLARPDDPQGFHDLPDSTGMTMRRARRIDVWAEDGTIVVDSSFQDSALTPDGSRVACHEYALVGAVDAATMTLTAVEPEARVLPYLDCPLAVAGARSMAGTPLGDLRETVLQRLAREKGCTHLNDALRALADVAVLAGSLGATTEEHNVRTGW